MQGYRVSVYGPWQRNDEMPGNRFILLSRAIALSACAVFPAYLYVLLVGLLSHAWLLSLRHPRLDTPVSACSFPCATNAKRWIMCLRTLDNVFEEAVRYGGKRAADEMPGLAFHADGDGPCGWTGQ